MDHYVLFKSNKRVTVREDDMSTEKIGRIFQVSSQNLYLTDDMNMAIFPGENGLFSTLDLTPRGHYEVHGDSDSSLSPSSSASSSSGSQRFSFLRTASSIAGSSVASPVQATAAPPRASMSRSFQRSIFIAECLTGKLKPSRTVVVRFMEFEATVPGITAKVQSALICEEPLILTDAQGNQIVESEGTKGSLYWKQNARKILAVSEEEFQRFQQESKRKRPSQRDDGSSGLQDVFERIEEVVLAAQGLQEVTSVMKELSDVASSNRRTTLVMTNFQAQQLQTAFNCHVCKGPFQEPMFAVCCRSIVGCKVCVLQWHETSSQCLKCRQECTNVYEVTGLSDALSVLKDIISVD
ncbi:hypothetical protein G5714_000177 [Onychostoma macrolepis]|uniref:RING-type domain-containing protein n=1 Tax=Onychostoma macrolepis TaxID=369639 RepID=A0A7J6DFM4_9TELE|nr:hypothetical protein G5714_000177 [Onychostoma macrolepis]